MRRRLSHRIAAATPPASARLNETSEIGITR